MLFQALALGWLLAADVLVYLIRGHVLLVYLVAV